MAAEKVAVAASVVLQEGQRADTMAEEGTVAGAAEDTVAVAKVAALAGGFRVAEAMGLARAAQEAAEKAAVARAVALAAVATRVALAMAAVG
jgi:hypothetical protein